GPPPDTSGRRSRSHQPGGWLRRAPSPQTRLQACCGCSVVDDGERQLRAVGGAELGLGFVLGRDVGVGEAEDAVALVVRVVDLRGQRVTAAVAHAGVVVECDPHAGTPSRTPGVNRSGRDSISRIPGEYRSSAPSGTT